MRCSSWLLCIGLVVYEIELLDATNYVLEEACKISQQDPKLSIRL